MAMRPFVISLVVAFSGSVRGGQGYKSALYTWWGPSLPRKHLQASASAEHPCGITWGRGGCMRGKQCLALSSPALAPGEAGFQEWWCKKQSWGDLTSSCSPQYCNLSFFSTLPGCALLNMLVLVFGVLCSDGDTECSGCFQLMGGPLLKCRACATSCGLSLGCSRRLSLRQHSSPSGMFNSENFGPDFPSLPVLCYID